MAERTCVVNGCSKVPSSRIPWCSMHYYRMRKHGSFGKPIRKPLKKVACRGGGCIAAVTEAQCKSGLCRRCFRRQWWLDHRDHESIGNRASSANRRVGESLLTGDDYRAILDEHGMTCHICGDEIESLGDLHFDHVIPLVLGGAHSPDNIRPAHASCNVRKGRRLIA